MKVCTKCGLPKDEEEFPLSPKSQGGRRAYCKSCANEYMKNYYNTKAVGRIHRLRQSAKLLGVPLDLPLKQFKNWVEQQAMQCHYCAQNLTAVNGHEHKLSDWTFDRKDNSEGYVIDNLVLACRRCNIIKGSWFNEQQMLEIAEKYLKS